MARRLSQRVEVFLRARREGGTEPALFVRSGRRYGIRRVEAVWKETGRWWDGEPESTTFRVEAALEGAAGTPGIYELRHCEGEWTLEIQD